MSYRRCDPGFRRPWTSGCRSSSSGRHAAQRRSLGQPGRGPADVPETAPAVSRWSFQKESQQHVLGREGCVRRGSAPRSTRETLGNRPSIGYIRASSLTLTWLDSAQSGTFHSAPSHRPHTAQQCGAFTSFPGSRAHAARTRKAGQTLGVAVQPPAGKHGAQQRHRASRDSRPRRADAPRAAPRRAVAITHGPPPGWPRLRSSAACGIARWSSWPYALACGPIAVPAQA